MAPSDFATAREMMVDGQIRPNKVTDPRIITAMRNLPRERFLPPGLAALAYADEDVPLGRGRVLMQPMVIARLVQAAQLSIGAQVLVVACGTGYGAALIASCGASVTAFEEDAALLDHARPILSALTPSVTLVPGRVAEGVDGQWDLAKWDVVLIEGAVTAIPLGYAKSLKLGTGRLLTVLTGRGPVCQAVVAEPSGSSWATMPLFDCSTPVLPALQKAPSFAF